MLAELTLACAPWRSKIDAVRPPGNPQTSPVCRVFWEALDEPSDPSSRSPAARSAALPKQCLGRGSLPTKKRVIRGSVDRSSPDVRRAAAVGCAAAPRSTPIGATRCSPHPRRPRRHGPGRWATLLPGQDRATSSTRIPCCHHRNWASVRGRVAGIARDRRFAPQPWRFAGGVNALQVGALVVGEAEPEHGHDRLCTCPPACDPGGASPPRSRAHLSVPDRHEALIVENRARSSDR